MAQSDSTKSGQGDRVKGEKGCGYHRISFLPGPVNLAEPVAAAMAAEPVSHRADGFVTDVQALKRRLCDLVHAQKVELLFGSATVANEALAAQLTQVPGKGLMLANGEFGVRLVEQARCWRLDFEDLEMAWGQPYDYAVADCYLAEHPETTWLWCTHCETSTGVLSDLERLKQICRQHAVRLCMDCVSSIGAIPVDLTGVYLATGTSGKALGAYAGLALVFYSHEAQPNPAIPHYLDLGRYAAARGIPFTLSSNLVYALAAALDYLVFNERRFAAAAELGRQVREHLRGMGLAIVAPEECAMPAVTTVALPRTVSSVAVGDALLADGYALSYKSRYLMEQNWIQVCLMGDYREEDVWALLARLRERMKAE